MATTVELLTTGVDVRPVRNIVFFKYVGSPIAFYQMLGRGTRIDEHTGKLVFTIYDYTGATRLLGESFVTKPTPPGFRWWRRASAAPAASAADGLGRGFAPVVNDLGRFVATSATAASAWSPLRTISAASPRRSWKAAPRSPIFDRAGSTRPTAASCSIPW